MASVNPFSRQEPRMAGLSWIGLSTRRRNFSSLTAGSCSHSSAFRAWSAPWNGYGASGKLRASISAGSQG
jgi:hypothetical protein